MKRLDREIISITEIAQDYYELVFSWDSDAGEAAQGGNAPGGVQPGGVLPRGVQPGNFVTVKAGPATDPVLRRPFAFSACDGKTASFIFQKRGRGTSWLATLSRGSPLDILGPLGNAFPAPGAGKQPVLIAGGIGLGPMLFLAARLREGALAGSHRMPLLLTGFRTAALIPERPGLIPPESVICTDDGSQGFKGTVGDWLDSAVPDSPEFYACGPVPMMAAVEKHAIIHKAKYHASVEQWMACGVGACMGCTVAMKDGSYERACKEGPIFDGYKIDWSRL